MTLFNKIIVRLKFHCKLIFNCNLFFFFICLIFGAFFYYIYGISTNSFVEHAFVQFSYVIELIEIILAIKKANKNLFMTLMYQTIIFEIISIAILILSIVQQYYELLISLIFISIHYRLILLYNLYRIKNLLKDIEIAS